MPDLLAITGLAVSYGEAPARAEIVRGVDLAVGEGEVVGLVGESGCGKTTALLAVLGLLPRARARVDGSVRFCGQELVGAKEAELARLRGGQIGAIFQNARGALHPMRTVGAQIARAIRRHRSLAASAAHDEAIEAFRLAGFPDPDTIVHRYPHQLSGGQCQRAMIAIALSLRPRLVLADEPTSGLDVTVQDQVLEMLAQRVSVTGTSLLLVSHDLDVIGRMCDRVAVMYAGMIVEEGAARDVLDQPRHPYTRGLIASLEVDQGRLGSIPGSVPDPRIRIPGCPFANRCAHVEELCTSELPPLVRIDESTQSARCVLYGPRAGAAGGSGGRVARC
ncbi:MAG: ABC transporter ATP-binding protein [Gaiellales bacterium]